MINPLLQLGTSSTSDYGALAGTMLGFMIGYILFSLFISLCVYIYFSLTLMKTAQKIKTEPAWLAWIPIANLYLKSKMAKMHWWPILLIIPVPLIYGVMIFEAMQNPTPVAGPMPFLIIAYMLILFACLITLSIFNTIWEWKICVARNRPGWWAVVQYGVILLLPFMFIPIFGFLILFVGIMAANIWPFVMWGILAWGK